MIWPSEYTRSGQLRLDPDLERPAPIPAVAEDRPGEPLDVQTIGGTISNGPPEGGLTTAVSSFLTQWFDPALPIKDGETSDKISREEQERLTKLLAVALHASQIPRRVGGDATKEELASDKRRSKRIAHVADQCNKAWAGKATTLKLSPSVEREAAQVDWSRWWAEHRIWLMNRVRYIATWSALGGDEQWAKSACVRLTNEMGWLEYAMRND